MIDMRLRFQPVGTKGRRDWCIADIENDTFVPAYVETERNAVDFANDLNSWPYDVDELLTHAETAFKPQLDLFGAMV